MLESEVLYSSAGPSRDQVGEDSNITMTPNPQSQTSSNLVINGINIPHADALAEKLGEQDVDAVRRLLSDNEVQVEQPEKDAVWISQPKGKAGKWNSEVVSCYYHGSRDHTASTVGKSGAQRSTAKAGEWAVSAQHRALMGNKTHKHNI